jgi:hypothetical protein
MVYVDENNRASLFSIVTPSRELEEAIEELLSKQLIRKDRQNMSIHRVVQEAVSYQDVDDLQESFNIASRLVHEQFPKQLARESLYPKWNTCQEFIPHGVFLCNKYSSYNVSGKLKAKGHFIKLLRNCAW